jgi:invasion protein IalB
MPSRLFLAGILATIMSTAALAADSAPTLLGAYNTWQAYQSSTADGRTCYVMAQPRSSEPAKAKRDPIYFLISDWPRRKAKAEMQIIPGYRYKDGSQVTAQVGADRVAFFTQNTTESGSAWVRDAADEVRLVEAMKRGSQVVVTGVSQRGTTTHDTFSLEGISSALDRIHAACGM